jgi:hypothetical protein
VQKLPPKFPFLWCVVFLVATFFLNSFLLVTSEAHWLRVWTMREQVRAATLTSAVTTALVWLILVFVGFLVVILTTGVGLDGVIDVMNPLGKLSALFTAGFWIAVIAVMFSTTDAQIYSFLVVSSFNTRTGEINEAPQFLATPVVSSTAIALCYAAVYVFVEISHYPFEPIVFFVFPIFLCAAPAFVSVISRGKATAMPVFISILLYGVCGAGMILFPGYSFPLSLAAPLMPGLISLGIAMRSRTRPFSKAK